MGTIHSTPERITFTHNNSSAGNFYGKKYATLVDKQALMWAAKRIVMEDWYLSKGLWRPYPSRIYCSHSSRYTSLELVQVSLHSEAMSTSIYKTSSTTTRQQTSWWCSYEVNTNRCNQCKLQDIRCSPWGTTDWVMTNNGVYQRSGLNFTLMSGVTFGTFNGYNQQLSSYQLHLSMKWNTWNETHNIRRKNNFFPGGFVGVRICHC